MSIIAGIAAAAAAIALGAYLMLHKLDDDSDDDNG